MEFHSNPTIAERFRAILDKIGVIGPFLGKTTPEKDPKIEGVVLFFRVIDNSKANIALRGLLE